MLIQRIRQCPLFDLQKVWNEGALQTVLNMACRWKSGLIKSHCYLLCMVFVFFQTGTTREQQVVNLDIKKLIHLWWVHICLISLNEIASKLRLQYDLLQFVGTEKKENRACNRFGWSSEKISIASNFMQYKLGLGMIFWAGISSDLFFVFV